MIEDRLLRELNPKYDFERHDFENNNLLHWLVKEPLVTLINTSKSLVRGGLTGVLAGYALGSMFDNPENGIIAGSIFGSALDAGQYLVRYQVINIKGMLKD